MKMESRDIQFDFIYGLSILLFILSPIIGFVFFTIITIVDYNCHKRFQDTWFILATILICLIQWNRIVVNGQPSDWVVGYKKLYEMVNRMPFFQYLTYQGKEPIYNIINYFGYYLTFGRFELFAKSIAIICISVTGFSIYKFWKSQNTNDVSILMAMVGMTYYFTEFFSQLQNLLRMWFALSFVILFMTITEVYKRNPWKWLLTISFVHTVTAIFFGLSFIKPLRDKINLKGILQIIVITCAIMFLLSKLSVFQSLFSNSEILTYGLKRLASSTNPTTDKNFMDPIHLQMISGFLISACLYYLYIKKAQVRNIYIVNVAIVLFSVVIGIITLAPELGGRIYVMRFFLLPFILPFLLYKTRLSYIYCVGIFAFCFIRFIVEFDNMRGGGFFPPMSEMLSYTIFHYVLYPV